VEASRDARTARDAALFDIVNRRQSRPKVTILITNLATRDITRQLDERVRSRMRQSFVVVDCTGEDMRRAA
jgi:DNA replication protein DnaC